MISLKKQVIYNLIGRFSQLLIGVITPVILVRLFTQTDYGLLQEILLISSVVATLLGFNIAHNLYYFFPIAKTFNEKSIVVSHTFFFMAYISGLFFIIAIGAKPYIIQIIDNTTIKNVYELLIMHICFTLLYSSVSNILIVDGNAKLAMYYYGLSRFVRTTLIIFSVVLFRTIDSVMVSLVLFATLNVLFFYSYLYKKYHISPSKFDLKIFKKQLTYILPFGLSGMLGAIGNQADKLILAALFSPTQFAIYRIGNFNLPFLSTIYVSVGNVILPRLSEYSKQKDGIQKALLLWKKYIIKNATVTFPVLTYFIFIAEPFIVLLFGEPYRDSTNVFRIILLSLVIQMFGYGYLLRAFDKTRYIVPADSIKLFLSICLGYILIVQYGYIGAAISYLIAYSSNGIIQLYFTRKLLKISLDNFLPWKDLLKLLIVSVFSLVPLFLLKNWYYDIHVAIYLIITSIAYFGLIFVIFIQLNYLPRIKGLKQFFKEI